MHQNGQLDSLYNYKNGLLDGKHENHDKGNIQIRQQYRIGKLNGPFTEYYPDGSKKSTGKYLNDTPDSKWEWYDENQLKTRLINYKRSGC